MFENVKIYDGNGQERDEAWLLETYGAVSLVPALSGPAWRLVAIHEAAERAVETVKMYTGDEPEKRIEFSVPEADAALCVKVLGLAGDPLENELVARWWPDPELPVLPPELQHGHERGVYGPTNVNGDIGFGMGHGDYYEPPGPGFSDIWLRESSDRMCGLGMLAGTNHWHLNLVFQYVVQEPEPDPEPEPEIDLELLREAAKAIRWRANQILDEIGE